MAWGRVGEGAIKGRVKRRLDFARLARPEYGAATHVLLTFTAPLLVEFLALLAIICGRMHPL
jgi:hypothetical protein